MKDYPERDWSWTLGKDAEDFAVGTISQEAMMDYNKGSIAKSWPLFDNTFRVVPMSRNTEMSMVNGCMQQEIFTIRFNGDDMKSPERRFAQMLCSFGRAKRAAPEGVEYDEERQFGTDTEECSLGMWFVGTNWFISFNFSDVWKATRALQRGYDGEITIYVQVEDFNNILLNSSRMVKAWTDQNYTIENLLFSYIQEMLIEDNTSITYGKMLEPYQIKRIGYDYGIINHIFYHDADEDDEAKDSDDWMKV